MNANEIIEKAKDLIGEGNIEKAQEFINEHKDELGEQFEKIQALIGSNGEGMLDKVKKLFGK